MYVTYESVCYNHRIWLEGKFDIFKNPVLMWSIACVSVSVRIVDRSVTTMPVCSCFLSVRRVIFEKTL